MRYALLFLSLLLTSTPAAGSGHELGVRSGGLDDFYAGFEWQTPARIGPAIVAPSLDLSFGDFEATALNGDLRWDLLPVFDSGIVIYGKAGPTLVFANQDNDIGLSLTIAADVGIRKGRSLQFEWRFGFGDIPDEKLGLALMFRL